MTGAGRIASGFAELIGLSFKEIGPDRVVVALEIGPMLHQPYGIVHGGVWCGVVESAASVGAGAWLGDRGTVVGVSNHTNFIRAAREGAVTATATPIHRGRTAQLWKVDVRDDLDRLVAMGEVRLQNLESDGLGERPRPAGPDDRSV
jgi:1,4-dihydroxy-2-naphthoyl-CoA hydrolase